jgi:hypothetical protein
MPLNDAGRGCGVLGLELAHIRLYITYVCITHGVDLEGWLLYDIWL